MNLKNTFTAMLLGMLVAGSMGAGSYFLFFLQEEEEVPRVATSLLSDDSFGWKFPITKFPLTGTSPSQLAYSDIRDPGGIPQGLPVRLNIPVIGVDTAIEDALITPDGRMDVPAGSINVAWFSLGPHPGEVGSAVIGGHFGIRSGVPFVFYNLDKLKVGDRIMIVNDKGDTITFVVRRIASFDRNADATTVFTSHDGLAHLNLITCEGVWNQVNDSYPERLVVFTDAVMPEIAPTSTTPRAAVSIYPFARSIGLGATGADVVALQTILIQKGLLVLPAGVAKGFFGALTGRAVTAYQTLFELPPVGTFGPLTRARLIADLTTQPHIPDTGDIEIVTSVEEASTTPVPTPAFSASVKSLYATPFDAFITLLLLVAIFFMTVQLFRKQ